MEIFTTMITPYKKDGSIDYQTAEKYVDWYFESGITGIFAVCQSSEIFYLSLEERVELNRRVYARAKALEKQHGKPFTVVSSGHISDTLEDQAKELNAIWESGTDALILITNRLDPNNEGDDTFIRNAEALLKLLPEDVKQYATFKKPEKSAEATIDLSNVVADKVGTYEASITLKNQEYPFTVEVVDTVKKEELNGN